MPMPINAAGIALLEEFESFVGHAYPDPYSALGKALRRAGLWGKYLKAPIAREDLPPAMQALDGAPWTIGLGFTKDVNEGDKMTRAAATKRLGRELDAGYVQPILTACTVEPNENELAAMACLAWNIGIAGFRRSSVLKAHNRGDRLAASRAFGLWNKAGGEESAGLTRRRAAESALYLLPAAGAEPAPMPQAVEPETQLRGSPIVTGTAITTGTATVGVAAEAARGVRDIRESLGDWLPWILVAVAIGAGGWTIWSRVKQRKGGWA